MRLARLQRAARYGWPVVGLIESTAFATRAAEFDAVAAASHEQTLDTVSERTRLQPIGDRWAWEHHSFRHLFSHLAGGYTQPLSETRPERGRGAVRPARLHDEFFYAELLYGVAWGAPNGVQHGASIALTTTLESQPIGGATLSYLFMWRPETRWLGYGRLGFPAVMESTMNLGWEVGVGAAMLQTAAFGLTCEGVLRWPYGVQSIERTGSLAPLVALQFGIWFDQEELP